MSASISELRVERRCCANTIVALTDFCLFSVHQLRIIRNNRVFLADAEYIEELVATFGVSALLDN